jgi:hypothetical protein
MEMPVGSISAEVPKKDQSLGFRGLYEVYVSPSTFFARLKDDPKVLVPYLVALAIMFAIVYFMGDIIARFQIDEMRRKAVENPNIPTNLSPDVMVPWIIGGGMAVWACIPLLAAALALFVGNFVMAGKATFKQLLSIMLFGEIIYLVGGLLVLPLNLAKDTMFMSFSLAALVPPDPESLVWLLLSKISLFLIWEIIAVGIGLSILYGFPRNKGYMLSVLSMGMLSILHVCFTAIRTLF